MVLPPPQSRSGGASSDEVSEDSDPDDQDLPGNAPGPPVEEVCASMPGLTLSTRNAVSLFGGMSTASRDLAVRRRKLRHLSKLCLGSDVVVIQELRGTPNDVGESANIVLVFVSSPALVFR